MAPRHYNCRPLSSPLTRALGLLCATSSVWKSSDTLEALHRRSPRPACMHTSNLVRSRAFLPPSPPPPLLPCSFSFCHSRPSPDSPSLPPLPRVCVCVCVCVCYRVCVCAGWVSQLLFFVRHNVLLFGLLLAAALVSVGCGACCALVGLGTVVASSTGYMTSLAAARPNLPSGARGRGICIRPPSSHLPQHPHPPPETQTTCF